MIIIAVVISIVFIIILGMIIKAYYKDIVETNERIQVLEKRIEEYKKDIKDDSKKENIKIYENLTLNNQDITRIIKELNNLRKKRENEKK